MSSNDLRASTQASEQANEVSPPIPQTVQLKEMSTRTETRRAFIDPDGELCLVVGGKNAVTFVVCPKTLARASPFFKTLLYGGFAESKQPGKSSSTEWIVELPEDCPHAMEILLNIIHSYFDKIPVSVDPLPSHSPTRAFKCWSLYKLTVITDKYDLTRILQPWAQNWVKGIVARLPLLGPTHPVMKTTFAEFLSWIAWELGDKRLFRKTAKYLTLHSVTDEEGGLRLDYGRSKRLFSYSLEPAGLSIHVSNKRMEAIQSMLRPVKDVVTRLSQGCGPSSSSLCKYHQDKDDCEVTMLGALIQSLTRKHLCPIPEPEAVSISIVQLADKLKSIDSKSRLHPHECVALPDITSDVDKVLDGAGYPILVSQSQYLKAQAKKTEVALWYV
ncbi:hypothetical protein F5Y13DRAFT_171829 [Hypoxylon sp. FL1857]|nr:hypothetical protein F5Y13DRAFT_171829 [Hypoxylon sp. FL1857]